MQTMISFCSERLYWDDLRSALPVRTNQVATAGALDFVDPLSELRLRSACAVERPQEN